MSWLDTYSNAARRVAKQPDDWHAWLFEPCEGRGVLVTGAVCRETITRGPRKGEPRFRTRDRTTEKRVFVSNAQLRAQRKREGHDDWKKA